MINNKNNVLTTAALVEVSYTLAKCFNALYRNGSAESMSLANDVLVEYRSIRKRIGYNTKTNARHGAYKAWEFMQGK